jgi:hypothetical protein
VSGKEGADLIGIVFEEEPTGSDPTAGPRGSRRDSIENVPRLDGAIGPPPADPDDVARILHRLVPSPSRRRDRMPHDPDFDRLSDELSSARAAVQAHLSTAMRAWRNLPPSEVQVAITSDWVDEHERLKERVEELEARITDRLKGR